MHFLFESFSLNASQLGSKDTLSAANRPTYIGSKVFSKLPGLSTSSFVVEQATSSLFFKELF